MIRKAKPEDAEGIINFVSEILPISILVKIGKSTLESNLRNGTQVSYIYDVKGIQAHASLYSESNVGILGNFAVSSSFRRLGISKSLMRLLEYDGKRLGLTHLSTYALLQHEFSQRLFDNQYIPIGVSLSSVERLNSYDELFDERMLNGEICLCKPLEENNTIVVPDLSGFERVIKDLYKSINVRVIVDKKPNQPVNHLDDYFVVDIRKELAGSLIHTAYESDYVCLGIFPSGRDGLNMLGFASKHFVKNLCNNYVTSNYERAKFVRTILLD
ncbi:MAG: GNAT family N-acetyltransferase [Candidatus Helarchaeota archaeon]